MPNHIKLSNRRCLRNTGIAPTSQIKHLKSGINVEEGYEHIMSFHCQMFLNHDDIAKLPCLLLISINEKQFRIFFTYDKIACFLCKSVEHTTTNCKKKH